MAGFRGSPLSISLLFRNFEISAKNAIFDQVSVSAPRHRRIVYSREGQTESRVLILTPFCTQPQMLLSDLSLRPVSIVLVQPCGEADRAVQAPYRGKGYEDWPSRRALSRKVMTRSLCRADDLAGSRGTDYLILWIEESHQFCSLRDWLSSDHEGLDLP